MNFLIADTIHLQETNLCRYVNTQTQREDNADITLSMLSICREPINISILKLICLYFRDLELNRSSSAVSMSCDTSDYSYATKYTLNGPVQSDNNMTELLEEPVEEKPEQVGEFLA